MVVQNLDEPNVKKIEAQEKLLEAMKTDDEKEWKNAMDIFATSIQDDILRQAKDEMQVEVLDHQALMTRGQQVLTSEETKFYNDVIANEGFAGVEQLVPATVFNRVFEELVRDHPLLSNISAVNTTGTTQWIDNNGDVNPAFWGDLIGEIQELLDNGFTTVNMSLYKLSAFIPVHNSMLDLGPTWLDQYVRTVLLESLAIALEDTVVNGSGNERPIGMLKDLDGPVTSGVYPDKNKTSITDLNPKTLGSEIMFPLTHDGKRAVNNVLLIVNPADYWAKIFPATTILNAQGTYVFNVLPISASIVQSVAVPVGTMVAGMGSDYFLGVGAERSFKVATEIRILQDQSVYVTRQLLNGRPKNNQSFLAFDISDLETGGDDSNDAIKVNSISSDMMKQEIAQLKLQIQELTNQLGSLKKLSTENVEKDKKDKNSKDSK